MITLDMKTVMLGNVIINVVGLIVILILWNQNRNKYPGLFYWVIDWAFQASGALLIALRGTVPDWASMLLSNSMIVGGNLILFFGLCRFAGKKISPSLKYLVLAGFAIFISVHSYYVFIHDVLLIRSFNASIGLSLGCFMGMWLLFKGANPEIRRISRGTGISFTIIVLISLVRMTGFVLLPQTTNDYLREGFFDTLLVLLLSGAIVFLVFNLVLMVTMRLYTESNQEIAERKKTEEELHTLFQHQETILSAVPDIIIEVDNSKIFTWANQAGIEFYGEDAIGKEASYYFEGEQDTYRSVQPVFNGSGETIHLESWQRRKDGEKRLLEWWCRALKDSKGNIIGALSAAQDITERKQAEGKIKASLAEKEVLLREIQHRVKNNMQVIASLLNMQSTHVKDSRDAALFKDAQERIRSMALVYERLYQSQNLSHINLNKYVTDLVGGLVHSYSIGPMTCRSVIDVPDIPINMDLAIPCGLIINEVVSNTLKYAFPDDRQGTISISIKAIDGNIEMTLADDGLGLPENLNPAQTASMGISLIHALAEHQLGGKVELERHDGTMYRITFPVGDKS